MTSNKAPRSAHLVGSVPMANAEEVFRTARRELGDHLRRVPDGETGERILYTAWQSDVLGRHPQFEQVAGTEEWHVHPRLRIKPGVNPDDLDIDNLGYADSAIGSYEVFRRLKQAGELPAEWKFMVALPSPSDPVPVWFVPECQEAVMPVYERAMLHEMERICDTIPHDQLALQWDAPSSVVALHWGDSAVPGDTPEAIIDRLVQAGNAVPADVDLGYHWCYGNIRERGRTLIDTTEIVKLTNAVMAGVTRPIQWIHLPVPQHRFDKEYYAPLENVTLRPGTELYVGLVSLIDGPEGTRRRIEAAQTVVPEFGVATECGFGRMKPDDVLPLLELHRAVAEPIR